MAVSAIVACTAFSALRVAHLRINHDQLGLLPDAIPAVAETRRLRELLGGEGLLIVALRAHEASHLKVVADDLAVRLVATDEIRAVIHKQPVEFIWERLPLFVATPELETALTDLRRFLEHDGRPETARGLRHPRQVLEGLLKQHGSVGAKSLQSEYFLDESGTMLLMFVRPNGSTTDLAFLRRLDARVHEVFADYSQHNRRFARLAEGYGEMAPGASVTYGLTGTYKRNLDNSESMQRALGSTLWLSAVGVLLSVLILMRRVLLVVLSMLSLGASVVVTYAFCDLVVGELNTVTAILGSIQIGMGIDFAIHFVSRLREELGRGVTMEEACDVTLRATTLPAIGSALTTSAALLLLALGDFAGFVDFGIVMSFGVPCALLLVFVGVPATLVLLARVVPSLPARLGRPAAAAPAAPAGQERRFPARPVLALGFVVTVGLVAAAMGIRFDYDGRSVMTANRPSNTLQDELDDRFDASTDPVVLYTESIERTQDLYRALAARGRDSQIAFVKSVFALVPDAAQQRRNRELLDAFEAYLATPPATDYERIKRRLLEPFHAMFSARPFGLDDLPSGLRDPFVPLSGDAGYLTFVYPESVPWDARVAERFAAEAGAIETASGVVHGGGMQVVFAELSRVVLRDARSLFGLAALAVFLIIAATFRSFLAALLVTAPLVLGTTWMLGLMALLGWRLNYMNIVVLPVIFATGIDTGVYVYGRFRETGSVWTALRQTASANFWACETTAIGWGTLLVSGHQGLASMGALATAGITCAFVISVTVLPALVTLDAARRARRAARAEQATRAARPPG